MVILEVSVMNWIPQSLLRALVMAVCSRLYLWASEKQDKHLVSALQWSRFNFSTVIASDRFIRVSFTHSHALTISCVTTKGKHNDTGNAFRFPTFSLSGSRLISASHDISPLTASSMKNVLFSYSLFVLSFLYRISLVPWNYFPWLIIHDLSSWEKG